MTAPSPTPPEMASHWMPSPWKVYSPSTIPPTAARISPATSEAISRAIGAATHGAVTWRAQRIGSEYAGLDR